ncbi:MAG: toxin-antitoxin system YwqK family antitoxin, partial [Methylophilaceae bacterium]|nr:toxin-antitoxin system YwqK family antitoxin [Methylophilaceae bacterium]
GKEHGSFTQWYDNGAKRSEANFKDGKKEGYEIYWEKNGDVKSKTLYEDGKPIK